MAFTQGLGEVVSLDSNSISEQVLQELYELEMDLWARGIGEYVYCASCDRIWNKREAFEKYDFISYGIDPRENVCELEKIIDRIPPCPCCNSETSHVYGKEHKEKIRKRHEHSESFLSVLFNTKGRVVGVMDGFYAPLSEIYEQEFYAHFHSQILDILEGKYGISSDAKCLTVSSLGTDDIHKSMGNIIALISTYVNSHLPQYDDEMVVVEGIRGAPTFTLFETMGATSLRVGNTYPEILRQEQAHPNFELDILFQAGGIGIYKEKLPKLRLRDIALFEKRRKSG